MNSQHVIGLRTVPHSTYTTSVTEYQNGVTNHFRFFFDKPEIEVSLLYLFFLIPPNDFLPEQ